MSTGRRESPLLLFWGLSTFWTGLLAAFAIGIWLVADIFHWRTDGNLLATSSRGLSHLIVPRCVLIACCHVVSLLGAISYRLAQAN